MGIRYTLYRIRYELERKLGILKSRHPANPEAKQFISIEQWRSLEKATILCEREKLSFEKNDNHQLQEKAEKIVTGEFLFFSSEWQKLGTNYDWVTNPESGHKYDISKHWSEIPDLSKGAGDIKFVWEKSRFSYLLTIIRSDYHSGTDLSEFVFSEIESWIDANPINQGPNWRCSQEISLRIFNWHYVLSYYKRSPALTEKRWQKIQNVIYWSLHHVYHHINFSRIAVRNNHAITETLFLALSDILFPFISETTGWAKRGRKWLEQEVNYQIYDDGTFLQFSMNYHRVVIQLLSLGIAVTEKNQRPLSDRLKEKAYKSLYFLYQCTQDENGWLPNYGSNDGAWFFPLSDTDYRDYRPQLNTLHYILTGQELYKERSLQEDRNWVASYVHNTSSFPPIKKEINKPLSFEQGGYYLIRQADIFTFIRCGNHKDRPAQADNLHIDIWHKDMNVLRDSGSYKYNTAAKKLNYFSGTLSHNTVMAENHSQMLKGSRFIWYYWTQRKQAKWTETEEAYIFDGEISAFRFINKSASHKRIVKISKHSPLWEVCDSVQHLDNYVKKQIWHPNASTLSISSNGNNEIVFNSYHSDYYGQLTNEKSIYFEFDKEIKTHLALIQ